MASAQGLSAEEKKLRGGATQEWPRKCFVFTASCEECPRPEFDSERMKYLRFQRELTEQGYEHWQGYVEFKSKTRITALVKCAEFRGWHWEPRKGTQDQARAYVWKEGEYDDGTAVDGTREEYGVPQEDGKEHAFTEAVALISRDPGSGLDRVAQVHPEQFVKHHRGLEALKLRLMKIQRQTVQDPPRVTWLWGPAGKGKSKYIRDRHVDVPICMISFAEFAKGWFAGYDGESVVEIHDWDSAVCANPAKCFNDLLGVADRYPTNVPIKGGYSPNSYTDLYITSNYSLDFCLWGLKPEVVESVKRRITNVIRFT